ncbi:MAG: 4-hydroxy-tetrahydrodipicolinate reductase [bacterium]
MTGKNRLTSVILIGAAGRMGRTVGRRFLVDKKVELAGAIDCACAGKSCGSIYGIDQPGPDIMVKIEDLPNSIEADIALDFSVVENSEARIEACMVRGWDVLIGTTGFGESEKSAFIKLAEKYDRRIVLVPNFTLGVNLLMKFSEIAGGVFEHAEIIELHHDKKTDAPSGTSVRTANLIASGRDRPEPPGPLDPSRGKTVDNIPIHSVRLPGLIAHQEVIFGGEGEILTIRHDTTDRAAFLPGIYLAIDRINKLKPGFHIGLDWAFNPTCPPV